MVSYLNSAPICAEDPVHIASIRTRREDGGGFGRFFQRDYREDEHEQALDQLFSHSLQDLEAFDSNFAVTAAAVSILATIPSYRLGKLILDCNKEISSCFNSTSDNLRFSITETLGLTIVEQSLWKDVSHYLCRVSNALRKHTGRPLPLTCTPMKFGSWMGGDRDGNPNVTAKVTRDVSLLSGWMIVDLYIREIDSLRFELSMNQCNDSLLRLAHEILQKDNSSEDWEECWNLAVGQRNQLKHHGQQAASLPKQLPAGADLPYCTECSGGESTYSRLEIPGLEYLSWN